MMVTMQQPRTSVKVDNDTQDCRGLLVGEFRRLELKRDGQGLTDPFEIKRLENLNLILENHEKRRVD